MFYPPDSPREKYEGILIKGLPEWFGRLKFRSGAAYEGGFRSGEFNGFGHYVVEGLYEYLGGYNEGKKEGYGREITVDARGVREEYVGGWKDNVKHGEGLRNGREWVRYYQGNQLQTMNY
jgi:1-phosphatidylinositol-4-phosphate 5-kinase